MPSPFPGIGIEEILEAVVAHVPPPADTRDKPLRALVFDSYYDAHRGVIVMFKVMDGSVSKGDTIRFMNTKCEYPVVELGVMAPQQLPVRNPQKSLSPFGTRNGNADNCGQNGWTRKPWGLTGRSPARWTPFTQGKWDG